MNRSAPSPAVLAARTPAPARVEAFDRRAWERAVIASGLHRLTRLTALVLAHHADDAGYLPAGGVQAPSKLVHLCRVTPKQARLALQQLAEWHYLTRPDVRDWPPTAPVRPVLLTLPPRPAPEHPEPES